MLPGSIARWANAFTGIVQFSGSSWSKAINPVQQLGVDAVYNGGQTPGEDARVSLAWLKAYGVGAVAISDPPSRAYWKPYAHPAKNLKVPSRALEFGRCHFLSGPPAHGIAGPGSAARGHRSSCP